MNENYTECYIECEPEIDEILFSHNISNHLLILLKY